MIPCGSREDKKFSVSDEERWKMLNIAYNSYFTDKEKEKIKLDDIELKNKEMIPTYQLLSDFQRKDKKNVYYFVMGSDVLQYIELFDDYDRIKREIRCIVIERSSCIINNTLLRIAPYKSLFFYSWESCRRKTNSTEVREILSSGKSRAEIKQNLERMIERKLVEYILKEGFYQDY